MPSFARRAPLTRLFAAAGFGLLALAAQAQSIVVASTTSTEQSGLFGHLLPEFKKASGIDVKVVALGTGQAIDMARRGDADVLFVHDKAAEEKFVADGFAERRYEVMYNDFILVGPKADPAATNAAPTSAVPSPSTSPAADTSGGTSGLLIAGLAVGAIVIVGVVIALVARRRA